MTRALPLLALLVACKPTQFPGATPADAAACRNVARDVSRDTWGKDFDDAYNDCMIAKGYTPSD